MTKLEDLDFEEIVRKVRFWRAATAVFAGLFLCVLMVGNLLRGHRIFEVDNAKAARAAAEIYTHGTWVPKVVTVKV